MIGFFTVIAAMSALSAVSGFLSRSSGMKSRQSSLTMANTIAVFGGTGMTGREVVYQALNSGVNVVVLARDPAKMLIPVGSGGDKGDNLLVDARLKVIKGDVTNQQDVDAVFASGDISGVVIALGGKTKDVGPTMLTDGTSCVIEGMKKKCTSKRIAVVTSIGAGDSEQQAPLIFKALMWTVMKGVFTDKNNQEKLFLSPEGPGHGLEYCIIRPGGLGLGAPTGVINVIDGQAGSIMRADVASFCLGAVTDTTFPYLRKTPCISSVGGTGWVKEKKAGFDAATTA